MVANSTLIESFVLGLTEGPERATGELAAWILSKIDADLSAEDLAALVDIFAHGEVLLRDGRRIPVDDGDGLFLTQWFELMMAWAPDLGLTVDAWRAFFWRGDDEARTQARERMAQQIRGLSFVQRVA